MPEFSLTNTWLIPAPSETVWLCLIDSESWPLWWSDVAQVQEVAAGDANGLNNVRQYSWRSGLAYRLLINLKVSEIHPNRYVAVEVSGDLNGDGSCQITDQPFACLTQIVFHWRVRTCKPWMDWFAILSKPVFAWNHARVMKHGELGLINYIETRKTLNLPNKMPI